MTPGKGQFHLDIPFHPYYVTIARLIISGIANHALFSIEEIEDLKVATSEALNFYLKQEHVKGPVSLSLQVALDEGAVRIAVSGKGLRLQNEWESELKGDFQRSVPSAFVLSQLAEEVLYRETPEGSEIHFQMKVKDAQGLNRRN